MKIKNKIFLILLSIILIGGLIALYFHFFPIKHGVPSPYPVEYKNNEYGFSFTLPETWIGFNIIIDKWQGNYISNVESNGGLFEEGPIILIRNPKWTEQDPTQDIPIMVLTTSQWQKIMLGELSVGAAPIPPSQLGSNSKYVFALPARYNYSYLRDWEEVSIIIENNPLKAFEP